MMGAMGVTADDLTAAIDELRLRGRVVGVHSSLRSFGGLDGGADAFIDAFLGAGCTLLVPTHSWGFATNHAPGLRPARNGWDYSMNVAPPAFDGVFSVGSNAIDRNMGAIPRAVLARSERVRGNHPVASFAAIGPSARDVMGGQGGDSVHAPLCALAEYHGAILLVGVGLTRMTLLHWAEQVAGRAQFRRWALDADGRTLMVESGGCSEGFEQLAPALAPVETRIRVGSSQWRCFDAADVVERAAAAIRSDAAITHCGQRSCSRCNDAALGGPILC
jgi:aminoglycoside 3-N-acetyltransferase